MQVFLPYAKPNKTVKCLDNKRLNKQILECFQIMSAITNINIGWKIPKYVYNHPCTLLWKNNISYLKVYTYSLLNEFWLRRKKNHACMKLLNNFDGIYGYDLHHVNVEFCKKHQEILLNKNYEHYKKYF